MCLRSYILIVYVTSASALSLFDPQDLKCRSSYTEYRCDDGSCVNATAVCNGRADCEDGSDEAFCDLDTSPLEVDHLTEHPIHRSRRQATCNRRTEWRCRNGSCISYDGKCDGKPDCPDGSDETFPLCRDTKCLPHWFRCAYGACVDGTAPCNGVRDCADNSDELLPRCRNESEKIRGKFKCADGSTIEAYLHCDGKRDCPDGSDETLSACAGVKCDPYVFQCAYGACVDALSNCTGVAECADGSDESDELCNRLGPDEPVVTSVIVPSGGACVLPAYPEHGGYRVIGSPNAQPGQSFDTLGLNITCEPSYRPLGPATRVCFRGTWSPNTPLQCVQYCRLNKDISVKYECKLTDGQTGTRPCELDEPDGTVVIPTCNAPNYYSENTPTSMRCRNGAWNTVERCPIDCGLVTPNGTGLIAGPEGKDALKGELPWHAGIYDKQRNYKQICGGSLINTRVVISAAHCFWDKKTRKEQPASRFIVALGKIYRTWNHPEDEESDIQRSELESLHMSPYFQGSIGNYQSDLAVLELAETIIIYPHVRPVCVNFDLSIQDQQLITGKRGKVAGWGLTEANGKPSEVLRTISLPYVAPEECLDTAPPGFGVFITGDKICGGFKNGSALCHGDSGGGYAFPRKDGRGLDRYYLRGVVSIGPNDGNKCNLYWLTTFTAVTRFEYFLRDYL